MVTILFALSLDLVLGYGGNDNIDGDADIDLLIGGEPADSGGPLDCVELPSIPVAEDWRNRLRRAIAAVTTPVPRTSAKSRTRFSSRLATLGVPRDRPAMAVAAAGSISTPRIPAERSTISARSLGS